MTDSPGPTNMMTFDQLEAVLPVKGKTLRRVLERLGYRRAPGMGRLYFSDEDRKTIEGAIQCRCNSSDPASARATGSTSSGAGSTANRSRSRHAPLIQKLRSDFGLNSKPDSGRKVVPLHHRSRPGSEP